MHMGGRNIGGTPGSSMAMIRGLFAGRQHHAETGGAVGQSRLGGVLVRRAGLALRVGVDDLREETSWALGDLEFLVTEHRRAADAVLQAQSIERAEQRGALRWWNSLDVEVADQA